MVVNEPTGTGLNQGKPQRNQMSDRETLSRERLELTSYDGTPVAKGALGDIGLVIPLCPRHTPEALDAEFLSRAERLGGLKTAIPDHKIYLLKDAFEQVRRFLPRTDPYGLFFVGTETRWLNDYEARVLAEIGSGPFYVDDPIFTRALDPKHVHINGNLKGEYDATRELVHIALEALVMQPGVEPNGLDRLLHPPAEPQLLIGRHPHPALVRLCHEWLNGVSTAGELTTPQQFKSSHSGDNLIRYEIVATVTPDLSEADASRLAGYYGFVDGRTGRLVIGSRDAVEAEHRRAHAVSQEDDRVTAPQLGAFEQVPWSACHGGRRIQPTLSLRTLSDLEVRPVFSPGLVRLEQFLAPTAKVTDMVDVIRQIVAGSDDPTLRLFDRAPDKIWLNDRELTKVWSRQLAACTQVALMRKRGEITGRFDVMIPAVESAERFIKTWRFADEHQAQAGLDLSERFSVTPQIESGTGIRKALNPILIELTNRGRLPNYIAVGLADLHANSLVEYQIIDPSERSRTHPQNLVPGPWMLEDLDQISMYAKRYGVQVRCCGEPTKWSNLPVFIGIFPESVPVQLCADLNTLTGIHGKLDTFTADEARELVNQLRDLWSCTARIDLVVNWWKERGVAATDLQNERWRAVKVDQALKLL